MSYHTEVCGHPSKVSEKIKDELTKNVCHIQYEEEIRQGSGALILKSLENLGSDVKAVRAKMSGSASSYASSPEGNQNNFAVEVTPLYGFID
jgi:hypothetical protein